MKRMWMFLLVVLVCFGLASRPVQADPIMFVYSSSAPNAFGSPSYVQWQNNALTALQLGSGTISNVATDPAAFLQISQMNDTGNISSQFNSWLGLASPSGNFAGEFGNRLMFPVIIKGNGGQVSLDQVDYQMASSDIAGPFTQPGGTFGFSGSFLGPTGITGGEYRAPGDGLIAAVGVNFVGGVPQYFFSTPGNPVLSSTKFDEILISGIGNALESLTSSPGGPTDQGRLDFVKGQYDATTEVPGGITMQFCLSTTYFLFDDFNTLIGQFTQNVIFNNDPNFVDPNCQPVPVPVPEPGSLALLGVAAAGFALRWRRNRLVAAQTNPSSSS